MQLMDASWWGPLLRVMQLAIVQVMVVLSVEVFEQELHVLDTSGVLAGVVVG